MIEKLTLFYQKDELDEEQLLALPLQEPYHPIEVADAISNRNHVVQGSSDSLSCLYAHCQTLNGFLQYENQILDSPKFVGALDSYDSSAEPKSSFDLLLALKHNSSKDCLALVDQYLLKAIFMENLTDKKTLQSYFKQRIWRELC